MRALKILVVDDEPVICNGCRMVLEERGHQVKTCTTCRQGIDAAMAARYDLILLDMKLPDRDGTALLETLHPDPNSPRVIVMSGYATVKSIINSMKKGALDFLPKPFTDDELVWAVEGLNRAGRAGRGP